MNREEIMRLLPHRPPMLLLDEVENQNGVSIGQYTVRGDEWFLSGHFPGNPIVPGVILCEMLAQSACVLLQGILNGQQLPVYTGMNRVRFRASVRPGDTVVTQCHIQRTKHPFYFAAGTVWVNGKLCAEAEFSFAITDAPH